LKSNSTSNAIKMSRNIVMSAHASNRLNHYSSNFSGRNQRKQRGQRPGVRPNTSWAPGGLRKGAGNWPGAGVALDTEPEQPATAGEMSAATKTFNISSPAEPQPKAERLKN
jgi:hypothetical protein